MDFAESKVHKIKSSLLNEKGQSFRLIITMPSVAYRLEAEQFHFVKTLSMREIYPFMKRNFNEWHSDMLKHLMANEYFEKQLNEIRFRASHGLVVRPSKQVIKKQGRERQPPSLEIINKRLSTKASERAQQAMRLSHSRIPG